MKRFWKFLKGPIHVFYGRHDSVKSKSRGIWCLKLWRKLDRSNDQAGCLRHDAVIYPRHQLCHLDWTLACCAFFPPHIAVSQGRPCRTHITTCQWKKRGRNAWRHYGDLDHQSVTRALFEKGELEETERLEG